MATNNKLTFTFTRDFVLGDKVELFIIDAVLPVGTVSTFTWVASATSAYEVEVGTPTATAGERSAINFAQSFSTSLTGYSVTQTGNQVVLITQTLRFSSVIAKDIGDNALIIPTDYDYVIATDSGTGNKITYGDKLGLVPKGTHVNQWWDDDANEVKTKFNLNDDRIGVNEDNILLKANLSGGNSFVGDQDITGTLNVTSTATFAGVSDTTLSNNFIPYHQSDALGFANSVIQVSGNKIGVNVAPVRTFHVHDESSIVAYLKITSTATGTGVNDGFDFLQNNGIADLIQRENLPLRHHTNNTLRHQFKADGDSLYENDISLIWKDTGGTERTLFELDTNNDLNIGGNHVGDVNFKGGSSTVVRARIKEADGSWEFFSNIDASGQNFIGDIISSNQFRLRALNTAPVSASDTGVAGEIRIDANYIYFCTATDTWKRVAIATW